MERFAIVDHGCKVNRYDGEVVRSELARLGLTETTERGTADLVVVNACAVTDRAVRRGRQALRALQRANPGARLLVTGCFTARDRERYVAAGSSAALIVPARDRVELRARLEEWLPSATTIRRGDDGADSFGSAFEDRARYYLKVVDGCDSHCAFCVIPQIRGSIRSKPRPEVLLEARAAIDRGFRELVVCGVHLGHYGRDRGDDLVALLDDLLAVRGDFRLRLGSLEASEVGDAIARRLASSDRLVPHLHVPLQSGDDGVLRAMRRPYTARGFADRIATVYECAPDLALTTDVIVGFPGETDAAFERTLDLVERLRTTKVHVFPYSPRAGTEAAALPERVPPPIVRARVRRLLALDADLAARDAALRIGRLARVLVHEVAPHSVMGTASRGLCERHTMVFVRGEFEVGTFVRARITGFEGGCFLADPLPLRESVAGGR